MKKFVALVAVAALVAFAAPAFAANPFMDVPMNHWAYDAVSQLAARGIVTGYPDGAFKGEWKATRYEMASVVARALAYVDMNKASKEDLELLKRLVVEFKDELDALGVKVEDLDERVSLIEERLGGWEFGGYFRTKAVFGEDDDNWDVDRFRLNMKKYLDDKVTMNIRLQGGGGDSLAVELAYLTIKDLLVEGSSLNVGRFWMDWEGPFYAGDWWYWNMNDAWVTDIRLNHAFHYNVPFAGMGDFSLYVAHDENVSGNAIGGVAHEVAGELTVGDFDIAGEAGVGPGFTLNSDRYVYGARLHFQFNEKFGLGLNWLKHDYEDNAQEGIWAWASTDPGFSIFSGPYEINTAGGISAFAPYSVGPLGSGLDFGPHSLVNGGTLAADVSTMWGDVVVDFKPGIAFKGQYFSQDLDSMWTYMVPGDDSPSGWKGIVSVDQDVLGFTSIWLEYAQLDSGFVFPNGVDPYGWFSYTGAYLNGFNQVMADTDIWNILLMQQWNDKWWTYLRYLNVDAGAVADYDNWTAAVQYWYTPNMAFELGYDKIDAGAGMDEDSIWLRTAVFF